jgi:hypothetical protein
LSPVASVAYLTDVEGHWDKLADFAQDNPLVSLSGDRLLLAPGATFVFGGDAIDRGPWSRRIVATLLEAKRRYGERVVLLAGNRDLNKLRLRRELGGFPPARAPRDVALSGPAPLLRWIMDHTMGARRAFEMRRSELASGGAAASDDDVAASFLGDLAPEGELTAYLDLCQLAYRHGRTLFVHGAVTEESLGCVPGKSGTLPEPDEWVSALNAFYREQMAAYREQRFGDDGAPAWEPLVAYQAPLPGSRANQASVVYGRPTDALLNPRLPSRSVVDTLLRAGIGRVVVGHTPSGDSPSVLSADGFQLVLADSSYGRKERGNQVFVDDERLSIAAHVVLDGGAETRVSCELPTLSGAGPLGLRDAASERLVKGTLPTGDYLTFRFLEGYAMEQRALSPEGCAALRLVPPW